MSKSKVAKPKSQEIDWAEFEHDLLIRYEGFAHVWGYTPETALKALCTMLPSILSKKKIRSSSR